MRPLMEAGPQPALKPQQGRGAPHLRSEESCWGEPAHQCLASSGLSHHEWWLFRLFFCLGKELVPFYILPAKSGTVCTVSYVKSQKLWLSADRFPPGAAGWDAERGNYSQQPPFQNKGAVLLYLFTSHRGCFASFVCLGVKQQLHNCLGIS